jgi:hypothetical protein
MRKRNAVFVGVLLAIALTATPALAARGHVFEREFGGPCEVTPLEPCEGKFKEPAGIAVNEQTGDVYVVDAGNSRVQYFTPQGSFVGQFTGPSATGTGNLEAGSSTVSAVSASAGAFTVGEEIKGEGLEPGTEVTAVEEAGALLKISKPVEAGKSKSGVVLSAHQAFNFVIGGAIAVDHSPASPSNGDVYVSSGEFGHMVVDKFSSTGAFIGQIRGSSEASPFELVKGVAVDPKGTLFISEVHKVFKEGEVVAEESRVDAFTSGAVNTLVPPFVLLEETQKLGKGEIYEPLAVDAEGNFYSKIAGDSHVWKFSPAGKLLSTELDPKAPVTFNGVAVESSTNDFYVDNETTVRRFTGAGTGVEAFGEGHLPSCGGKGECQGGLAVNSATGRVYVGVGPSDVVQVWQPEPAGPPLIAGEWLSSVSSTGATFSAEVKPRSVSTEEPTTYRFEYGACAGGTESCATSGFEASTPVASLPPSFDVARVSVEVNELRSGMTYHVRLVAENAVSKREGKPAVGEVHTFTTRGVGVFGLPDARQWELVSPPDKHGAALIGIEEVALVQASPGGAAIAWQALAPTEAHPQGLGEGVQVLSTRSVAGWSSLDLEVPHSAPVGLTGNKAYPFFSEDLSLSLLDSPGRFVPSLSPEASEQTPYVRADFSGAGPASPCTEACFQPLVTGCPPEGQPCAAPVKEHQDVPPGTVFGPEPNNECPHVCGPEMRDATPDLSHVVLRSTRALTATSFPGLEELYEWSGGKLALVSLLPSNEPAVKPSLGFHDSNRAIHAISTDGSRVFWEDEGRLYVRDTRLGETLEIGPRPFEAANAAGTLVFAGGQECEITTDAMTGKLKECATVGEPYGNLLGTSEDGAWVYYERAGSVYVRRGATTRLVAAGVSGLRAAVGADQEDLEQRHWRVSPDGEWFAFMSNSSLTGYDNEDVTSRQPGERRDEEVFLYDARHERLVCASCDPTGARPAGVDSGPAVGGWPGGTWIAGSVPGWTTFLPKQALYQSRYLSNEGRLFFNSSDALVPKDVNGQQDVYQFEPEGVPTGERACTSASGSGSVVFNSAAGGCVGLISSGESPEEAKFVDASQSGGDVFFLSSGKLSRLDQEGSVSLYDAHECTSSSPCVPQTVSSSGSCETEASCKASPGVQPDIFAAGGSAVFSGPGNPPPLSTGATPKPETRAQKLAKALGSCRRRYRHAKKKRQACERSAHRKYGAAAKAKRATHNRRTK